MFNDAGVEGRRVSSGWRSDGTDMLSTPEPGPGLRRPASLLTPISRPRHNTTIVVALTNHLNKPLRAPRCCDLEGTRRNSLGMYEPTLSRGRYATSKFNFAASRHPYNNVAPIAMRLR
jgi:hypothetical protein